MDKQMLMLLPKSRTIFRLMRNLASVIAASAFILASSAQALDAPKIAAADSAAVPSVDEAALTLLSAKLNTVTTLEAKFTEIDPQGTATGRFYLSRPGGVRFEYDPPRKVLVIANDRVVSVQDRKTGNPYRVGVSETPLKLLLKQNIDLKRDADIRDIHREGGMLYMTAAQTKGYGQGQVTFIFSEPNLQLQRWIATDPTGAETMVTLNTVQQGVALDKSLFDLPEIDMHTGFGPVR
ncbi:MAG TPA: outer membrane lipoprotein carrier protein LolA [Alphaproteobacteria bacterium]|nr:outer membrane lipoprotein carrier protein LolA [Alphaproteobacteria bacterium]